MLSWIIIWVWIRWVFFSETPESAQPVDTPSETEQNAQRRYISEKVLLAGEITKRSGFGLSTHMFIDSNWNEFGVRSEEFSLSEYEGQVQIKWEIVDFDKEIPIILVQDVIKESNSDEDSELPAGNENFWWSQDANLGIDLSASNWLAVSKVDWEIRIVESTNTNEPLLTIQPFDCIVWDALQDCSDLKDKFTRFGNDSFVNAKWVTFYNLTETNTWFMFDLPQKWYSLRSSIDNSVSGFADLIQIVNDKTMESLFETSKNDYCRSLESRMDTTQSISWELIKPWLVAVTGVWSSQEGNEVTCMMYIILWEKNTTQRGTYKDDSTQKAYEQEVVLVDNSVDDSENDLENKQEEPEIELVDNTERDLEQEVEDETEIIVEEIVEEIEEEIEEEVEQEALPVDAWSVDKPSSLDGWLQYTSVRWFDMYFSKQWVSYVWEILGTATGLGIEGASCIYKVNVIAYQQAENVSSSPDLAIFECSWTVPSAEQAKSLNIQVAGSTDNAYFVVQKYTSNLWDIQVYVE